MIVSRPSQPPTLITAPARSGTSMTAGLLARACGVWCGPTSVANEYNPRGFFENVPIIDATTKRMLYAAGFDPMGQSPIPEADTRVPAGFDLRQTVEGIVRHQGYTGGPWLVKEAKMVLTWEAWRDAFPEATWLICERDNEEIVASCLRTPFMFRRKSADAWYDWIRVHRERLASLSQSGARVYTIRTGPLAQGDFSVFERLCEQIGLEFNYEQAAHFVMPEAWNRGLNNGSGEHIASADCQ